MGQEAIMSARPQYNPTGCHPSSLWVVRGDVHIPGIRFYADNNLLRGPEMPKQWRTALNARGGHEQLVLIGPPGTNGDLNEP
jgi:hypothetical protein